MAIERRWVVVCDGCCATTPEGYAPTKREAARLATGVGYRNVHGAELVVQHDGGDLRDYFDTADGVYLRDRMYAALNAEGFRVEKINAFSTAIYAD